MRLSAAEWVESAAAAKAFEREEVSGTFVVLDVGSGQLSGHDEKRAKTRYVPASTYKIPNTLIGLQAGSVKSVDEVLPYGGKPQSFEAWEHDMSLRDAIKISCVPIYQELARRTGLEVMQAGVTKLGYGNGDIGTKVDRFWLDGPLKISAVEQVRFLARLAAGELPFPPGLQQATRDIVKLESGEGWALFGKSGWENAPDPGIGWWVGWVENRGKVHAFALNMDMNGAGDAAKREALGREILAAMGLLEASREPS
nr:class D beta-lactamase [Luteolibacter marinus]